MLNTAEKFYADLCGMPEHEEADLRLAMRQTKAMADAQAGRFGTPARKRYPRHRRAVPLFMKLKGELRPDGKPKGENVMCKPRLFKGHRA